MRLLFIGGTGTISRACVRLALERGHEVTLLNRGNRPTPDGAELLEADANDAEGVRAALGDRTFDSVAQFVAFVPEQIERDIALYRDRTRQYVFMSSASAYQTPPRQPFITEGTTLANPHWEYSRNKIACEEVLIRAHRDSGFPAAIVRPSHTYDERSLPLGLHGKTPWTVPQRMLDGKPVIVPGDGTSLWVVTHSDDFAEAFVPLLGDGRLDGEAVHITSEEVLTWDAIYRTIADALGVRAELVHIPSDLIAAWDPDQGPGLLGDKAHSVIFDNTKVRRLVPSYRPRVSFAEGARRSVAWFRENESRREVDDVFDSWCDKLLAAYAQVWP
jgi:nucleoside-diphosphate-sugar epimerase